MIEDRQQIRVHGDSFQKGCYSLNMLLLVNILEEDTIFAIPWVFFNKEAFYLLLLLSGKNKIHEVKLLVFQFQMLLLQILQNSTKVSLFNKMMISLWRQQILSLNIEQGFCSKWLGNLKHFWSNTIWGVFVTSWYKIC